MFWNKVKHPYLLYVLRCSQSHKLYYGITNNIDKRLRQHNREIPGGAKETIQEGRGPWMLKVIIGPFPNKQKSLELEGIFHREKVHRTKHCGLETDNHWVSFLISLQTMLSNPIVYPWSRIPLFVCFFQALDPLVFHKNHFHPYQSIFEFDLSNEEDSNGAAISLWRSLSVRYPEMDWLQEHEICAQDGNGIVSLEQRYQAVKEIFDIIGPVYNLKIAPPPTPGKDKVTSQTATEGNTESSPSSPFEENVVVPKTGKTPRRRDARGRFVTSSLKEKEKEQEQIETETQTNDSVKLCPLTLSELLEV